MELTNEQRLFQTIVEKAWEDNDFKAALIENPLDAIESLIGTRLHLPEGKTLKVYDQTNVDTIYVNINAEPNLEDVELTEEQLEIIAGGGDPLPVIQNANDPLQGTSTGG